MRREECSCGGVKVNFKKKKEVTRRWKSPLTPKKLEEKQPKTREKQEEIRMEGEGDAREKKDKVRKIKNVSRAEGGV